MGDLYGFATFYRYGWVNRRESSMNRHVCLGIPKGLSSHCFIESMMCIPVSIRDTPIFIDICPSPSKILGWPPWVSYGERQGLVVWNMIFVFPYIYIGNFFIPTDDSYFSEGRLKHQPDYIKCKDDDVGTLGWSRSFSVYPDQHPSLTSKRLPWYQGLDPVPMCMMIKEPSKPGSESGLSDMVNILPVLFSLLLLL